MFVMRRVCRRVFGTVWGGEVLASGRVAFGRVASQGVLHKGEVTK